METIEFLNPQYYREIKDETVGLQGYFVIDKMINGKPVGGIRMAEGLSLTEVANLAREMTLKYAFLNIKKDGAKAGIIAPHDIRADQKKDLCRAFGRGLKAIIRETNYIPGEDLGTHPADLKEIYAGADLNYSQAGHSIKSDYFTALTVFLTIREVLYSTGKRMEQTRVVIEGFGKVGGHTAKLFSDAGARIIGISTINGALYDADGLDLTDIFYLKEQYGDALVHHYPTGQKLSPEALIEKETDVLVPGARPDAIHAQNVDRIKAKIIVPIANIAATGEMEDKLHERGILFIPGFVSNSGGILCYFLVEQNFVEDLEDIIREGFPIKIRNLIQKAKSRNQSFAQTARGSVERNIQRMQKERSGFLLNKLDINRVAWVLVKKLVNSKSGSMLRPFARQYIFKRVFQ